MKEHLYYNEESDTHSALLSHNIVTHGSGGHVLELAVNLCPVLRTTDHTCFITCCYFLGFYTTTKLHYVVTEAQ